MTAICEPKPRMTRDLSAHADATALGDSPPPPAAVVTRVHALYDELADFQASEGDAALAHLLHVTADLVSAQNAYWLGVVRMADDPDDGLCGWRPRAIQYLHPSASDEAFSRQNIRDFSQGLFDESARSHARQAGCFRATVIRDLVSPAWFENSMFKRGYEARGIIDTLFVVFPVNDSAECYYGFLRTTRAGLFTPEDVAAAAYALRGLKWFHRQVMLSHGLDVAGAPLAPMEREVLKCLLTDLPEKQIAAQLQQTVTTTHKYVTSIFRKFGVSGRSGLTALWLGKGR